MRAATPFLSWLESVGVVEVRYAMDVAAESGQEAMVSETLVQYKATLDAAVQEVQVDVKAFKQRIEQKIEELCVSNSPLAGAVAKLQEENLQLRAKLEALSHLVDSLADVKSGKSPAEVREKSTEDGMQNGHVLIQPETQKAVCCGGPENQLSQSTFSDPTGSSGGLSCAPISSPAPPPWRAKRHAETNVSTWIFYT